MLGRRNHDSDVAFLMDYYQREILEERERYLPTSYTASSFHVGQYIFFNKGDNKWSQGVVGKVTNLIRNLGTCDIHFLMLGKEKPGTILQLSFPNDFRELEIVETGRNFVHPIKSFSELRVGRHLRYKYRGSWEMGKVMKPDIHASRPGAFRIKITHLDDLQPTQTGTIVIRHWISVRQAATTPEVLLDIFTDAFSDDLNWEVCDRQNNVANPKVHNYVGDPSIKIPDAGTLSAGEIYELTLKYGNLDVIDQLLIPRMNSSWEYRRALETKYGNTESNWVKYSPGPEGLVADDIYTIIAIRILADWKNCTFQELLGDGLKSECKEGGWLFGMNKKRILVLHAALSSHSQLMHAVARDVSENFSYRYNALWGPIDIFRMIIQIANLLKGAGKHSSFDEIVIDSASTKAKKFLFRFPLKNHDWGFAVYPLASNLEGTLSAEHFDKYKGKGYLHSLILRVKGKYKIDGPYAYYGVAGDLLLQALLRDVPLDNLGLFLHGDSFFTSPHSCYNARCMGTNYTGPVKTTCFGAKLLPREFKEIKERVQGSSFLLGQYATLWSPNSELLFLVQKSNKAVPFLSTCYKNTDQATLNRWVTTDGRKELKQITTSAVHASYTMGMGGCDAFAGAQERTNSHRYNPKFGKTLDDFALFALPVVETWIIYRGANIESRATIPNVQEEIFKHLFSKYNSPFLAGKYLTKKKRRLAEIKADDLDPIPKISKRFSKKPVSQLTRAQMYYELGPSPRPKYDIDFENGGPRRHASTWRDHARSCTSLTPVLFPYKTRQKCPYLITKRGVKEPCGKRVASRCTSCGCYGCIKPEGKLFKTHLQKLHTRQQDIYKRLRRNT